MKRLSRLFRRLLPHGFARETRGSVTVETLIIFPILAWALVATVVFFDGFRTRNQTQVAAQIVADLLSREPNMFTTAYLEGMNEVFDFIADARVPTRLRISSVMWSSAEQRNTLQWSYGTRGLMALPPETFEDLQNGAYQTLVARFNASDGTGFSAGANQAPAPWLADRIPPVLPGEALIVVESFAIWSPFANVGVGQMRFAPVVVTRPRFSPWINLEGAVPVFPEEDYEVPIAGYYPRPPEQLPDPVPPPPPPRNVAANQDFSTGAAGWSNTTTTTSSVAGINTFLGPFGGETWASPITRRVDLGAADRASARIEFDLLVIGGWDHFDPAWSHPEGDVFQIRINDTTISSDTFASWTGWYPDNNRTATVNHEGAVYTIAMTRTRGPEQLLGGCCERWQPDSIWRVTVDIQAPPQVMTIGVSMRSETNVRDEAFGIDNFRVTWQTGTRTPAPFTANAAAMVGLDPFTRFRTYSGCPQAAIATNWMTMRNSQLWPINFRRRAGGTQALAACGVIGGGFIQAQPTMVMNYVNDGDGQNRQRLRIRTNDGNNGNTCDSTLLVRDPDGRFWFNNNLPGFGSNAGLNMGHAPTGAYTIWLGRRSSGFCTTGLIFERY